MRNNGKDAEAGWLSIVDRAGGVVERFWDSADLRGRNGGRAVGAYAQPSDFLLTLHGALEYAEVKSTNKKVSFPFSDIQPAQSSAALRQALVGGPYNFYIYSYFLEKWFVLPCRQYKALVEAGCGSAKFEDLDEWKLSSQI